MDAESRRNQILNILAKPNIIISASAMAKELQVSRQVIVGDIAILRAQGHDIIATARGYMIPKLKDTAHFIGKVACKHLPRDTKAELYAIVDLDAAVINIIVEHELYGEITGNLNLINREDVDAFINKVESMEIKLLSELTSGIHLHTIACRDKNHFEQVHQVLKQKKFII